MGAQSFFGGLLGGVGQGVLQREQMDYAQKMKDTEARRQAMEMLVQSGALNEEQQALAVKALITPTLQNPSIMARFVGGLKKTTKGGRSQSSEAGPLDQFFSSFEPLGRTSQPPATTGPVPQPRTMREIWAERESQARLRESALMQKQTNEANWQQRLQEAETIDPTHGERYQDYLAHWTPREPTFKLAYGAEISGNQLPPGAVDLSGIPIADSLRTKESLWKKYKYGNEWRFEPAAAPRSAKDALMSLTEAYKVSGDPNADPFMRKAAQTIVKQKELGATAGQTWRVWEDESGQHIARLPSKGGIPNVPKVGGEAGTEAKLPGQVDLGQKITSTTKTMIEAAPKVRDFVARIRTLINQQRAQLGPAASRWNEFMTGKIGSPNPQFARLRTDTSLLQTLLMRMHAGARGSQYLMAHFKDLVDSGKQSPENLLAALDEIDQYAQSLQTTGKNEVQQEPAREVKTANDLKAKYGIK
jgi:hypothetical protein